jgi:hypothetical protein
MVLCALAIAIASCRSSSPRTSPARTTVPITSVAAPTTAASSPTTTTVIAPVLRDSLASANAAIDAAPPSIRATFGLETCGVIGRMRSPVEESPGFQKERRCFLDAYAAGRGSALVRMGSTTEGDPVVYTEFVLTDGRVVRLHDFTKDTFGEKHWYAMVCRRTTTDFPNPATDPTFYFIGDCDVVESVPLPPPRPTPPPFFVERVELPICGFALAPSELARFAGDCFRAAIVSGSPAELVVTAARNDREIVVHWLRVLAPGSFEMLTNTRPGDAGAAAPSWTKRSCTRLDLPPVKVAPLLIDSDCQIVQTA